MTADNDPEREYLLRERHAYLLHVQAIEERLQTRTVTVTALREKIPAELLEERAKRLGVVNSPRT